MTQTIQVRLLALQTVLTAKGVVADAEIAAELQALSDAATLELEYGDDPLPQQFRRMRRLVEGGGEPPKDGPPQQDAGRTISSHDLRLLGDRPAHPARPALPASPGHVGPL
jgi:hypothetical protein